MHSTLRILSLFVLGWVIQAAGTGLLAALCALLTGWAILSSRNVFVVMLRRARWLLLTLLLIYAMTTPGEYVQNWPAGPAPSYEGILAGGLQLLRLVSMLAALAVLLGKTRRDELMAGIYVLMQPLRWFGVSPERLTARLWLTLHYVEQSPQAHRPNWNRFVEYVDMPGDGSTDAVLLHIPQLKLADLLWLLLMLAIAAWSLL